MTDGWADPEPPGGLRDEWTRDVDQAVRSWLGLSRVWPAVNVLFWLFVPFAVGVQERGPRDIVDVVLPLIVTSALGVTGLVMVNRLLREVRNGNREACARLAATMSLLTLGHLLQLLFSAYLVLVIVGIVTSNVMAIAAGVLAVFPLAMTLLELPVIVHGVRTVTRLFRPMPDPADQDSPGRHPKG